MRLQVITLNNFSTLVDTFSTIIAMIVAISGAVLNWRKSHNSDKDTVINDYKDLYQKEKQRCDELEKENAKLRKELDDIGK